MKLKVIGAGFRRTGTESMRTALDILGFGPCHHMFEVIDNPEQTRRWRALVAAAAILAGCDTLLTENRQNGRVFEGVKITNPFAP